MRFFNPLAVAFRGRYRDFCQSDFFLPWPSKIGNHPEAGRPEFGRKLSGSHLARLRSRMPRSLCKIEHPRPSRPAAFAAASPIRFTTRVVQSRPSAEDVPGAAVGGRRSVTADIRRLRSIPTPIARQWPALDAPVALFQMLHDRVSDYTLLILGKRPARAANEVESFTNSHPDALLQFFVTRPRHAVE
jgi:hypothetical protein